MAADHTPGPWDVAPGDARKVFTGRHAKPINAPTAADARLIAAAPDLLEACEQALMHIEGDESTHGRTFAAGNVIRTAIAKALHVPPNNQVNRTEPEG